MRVTGFNHVSIHAPELEESLRFWVEIFGAERIPAPTFPGVRVEWLRVGDLQLHLFERDVPAPSHHHIGFNVDDFEAVYRKAKELDALEEDAWGARIRELPDGSVQMYLRDPSGNLIEIDWPDVTTLDRELIPDIKKLEDQVDQRPESAGATLFLEPRVLADPVTVASQSGNASTS
jgi:catechol 2,3-dioxygenase-like lactoylglutathione lyase family enzyme